MSYQPSEENTQEADAQEEDAKWAERRSSARVVFKTSISFNSDSNFYTGFTDNISEGGIFVATYNELSMGEKIRLDFSLPDGGPPIQAEGEVRWLREFNPSSDTPPGIGFRFVALPAKDHQRIERFIKNRDTLFFDDD
ncbi:MAG: TIGR02266 family protein [Deltaproteobacteria bacterium]|nr:TIGR02266 family protein [Deltaproteobacteria bacterium]